MLGLRDRPQLDALDSDPFRALLVWAKSKPSIAPSGREVIGISAKPIGVWGCVSAIDPQGRMIWIVDAHREDGRRFVVHADEKLTAFLELESTIRAAEPQRTF